MDTKALGKAGEEAAANYLVQQGCMVLARNFRLRSGEIDLIAEEDGTIVFVEVKTRTTMRCGRPAAAVNYHKQQKIIRTAEFFLRQRHLSGRPCRFDVMEVFACDGQFRINHLKGAFEVS